MGKEIELMLIVLFIWLVVSVIILLCSSDYWHEISRTRKKDLTIGHILYSILLFEIVAFVFVTRAIGNLLTSIEAPETLKSFLNRRPFRYKG